MKLSVWSNKFFHPLHHLLPSVAFVLVCFSVVFSSNVLAKKNNQFVVALVSNPADFSPKWTLRELSFAMKELKEFNPEVVVIAYRSGVQALRVDDRDTARWVKKLSKQGVKFKVGRNSMKLWGLTDDDMPVSVEIVPSGLAEMMDHQMKGFRRLTF